MCRQGSSVLQTQVLEKLPRANVEAYVVWVPILPEDGKPGAGNLALVADPRAHHFWDEQGSLSPQFHAVLGLPSDMPAWDVYLAYPRRAGWADVPSVPAFWHHQLGNTLDAPVLDGELFLAQLRELIEKE
jgi:hypothetical protein